MTPPTTPTLFAFGSVLAALRVEYGEYVIAPPTDPKSPVAILLPLAVRYCATCQTFKPTDAMLNSDYCHDCSGSTVAPDESQTGD